MQMIFGKPRTCPKCKKDDQLNDIQWQGNEVFMTCDRCRKRFSIKKGS